MNETTLTIIGNLTADPILRFTQNGEAVANFNVATTPRYFNKRSQSYEDGDPLFLKCNIWKEPAENVAESLVKGQRVIVTGRLKQTSWEDKDTGAKRTGMELEVDEIGTSLRFGTTRFSRTAQGGGQQAQSQQAARVEDPWGPADDEPPF